MDLPLKELLLSIPAGAPAQHAADVEIFAEDVPPHVFRGHSLGRALVVGAAGCVNMMVAGKPVHARHVDPSLEVERFMVGLRPLWHGDVSGLALVLGAPRVLHRIRTRRQRYGLPALTVNLRVEEEVRRQSSSR